MTLIVSAVRDAQGTSSKTKSWRALAEKRCKRAVGAATERGVVAFEQGKGRSTPIPIFGHEMPQVMPQQALSPGVVPGERANLSVEVRGFEPLTFSMPWRRATNCAIPPCA